MLKCKEKTRSSHAGEFFDLQRDSSRASEVNECQRSRVTEFTECKRLHRNSWSASGLMQRDSSSAGELMESMMESKEFIECE